MTETILGTSTVYLFGRVVSDLFMAAPGIPVRVATTGHMTALTGLGPVDGVQLSVNDLILVRKQNDPRNNGIYQIITHTDNNNVTTHPWHPQPVQPPLRGIVQVAEGTQEGSWQRKPGPPDRFEFEKVGEGRGSNMAGNRFLENQRKGMVIARIYGFSYEGNYYDLPRTILFGVHGEGDLVTLESAPAPHPSRAPRQPSLSGVGAADFEFADDIRVWSYDKADYTIRMDVETGMFEQVLLDIFFDGGGGVSGARVSGARVSGARVSGARVSGARVSGARVGGPRGDASD
jgi:hypothetical protein